MVQQPPDVLGSGVECLRMLGETLLQQLNMLQRMFQGTRKIGQCREPDSGRAACQRVRQRHRAVRQRLVQFQRPFLQRSHEAARPFVGLVEVHVVQRYADAQVLDDLDRFVDRFLHRTVRPNRGFGGLRRRYVRRWLLVQDELGLDAIRADKECLVLPHRGCVIRRLRHRVSRYC